MKTIYYTDELNDDFAATNGIKTQALPPDYKWIHTGFLRLGTPYLFYGWK